MTLDDVLRHINSLKTSGIRLGLDHMYRAAHAIGDPQNAFDVIHIAGTNGKGSTASLITAALVANGYTVGTYTSPAITDLRDTVHINGIPVDTATFTQQAARLCAADITDLTEFEWVTLLAFCCFEAAKVNIAVIECGLGGESDATNILPTPKCAVLTPIDIDHAGFLGDTIEKIAAQKCGIIKQGCPVVCSAEMNEDALGVIFERAAENGAIVHLPAVNAVIDSVATPTETRFVYRDTAFQLAMHGAHQINNALTALCVLDVMHKQGYTTDPKTTATAFSRVHLPCRQEWITDTVLLDGAHNPHGICALADTLRTLTAPVTLVIGMLKDKDIELSLRMLLPLCKRVICCTPINPRAATADELSMIASRYHTQVAVIGDPVEAFKETKKSTDIIVVGGSFYTAGAVRHHIVTEQS